MKHSRRYLIGLTAAVCSCSHTIAPPSTGLASATPPTQSSAGPASAPPPQFVLFETDANHRGKSPSSSGKYMAWTFEEGRKANPSAPTNWLDGGEHSLLNTAIYHFRVEVRRMERAWESPMHLQFGWSNRPKDPGKRHIASPQLRMIHLTPPPPDKPWVYEMVGTVRALDKVCMYYGAGPNSDKQVTDWDWSNIYQPNTFYTLVRAIDNNLDIDGDGKLTEAEFPDIEFHAVLTIHRPASPAYEALAQRIKGFSTPAVSFAATAAPQ